MKRMRFLEGTKEGRFEREFLIPPLMIWWIHEFPFFTFPPLSSRAVPCRNNTTNGKETCCSNTQYAEESRSAPPQTTPCEERGVHVMGGGKWGQTLFLPYPPMAPNTLTC